MRNFTFRNIRFASSIEDVSILRKFTVLFLLMSIIPLGILYYFYWQIKEQGVLDITEDAFAVTLFLVVIGIAIGYLAMRSVLRTLMTITHANKQALETMLGRERLRSLSDEKNEIIIIAKTFREATDSLEENIKSLEIAQRTLHSVLAKVGEGIASWHNIDTFLNLIVETIVEAFSGRVGILFLSDPSKKDLYIKAVYGITIDSAHKIKIRADQEPFARILKNLHASSVIQHLDYSQVHHPEYGSLFEAPMLAAPLTIHKNTIGILVVCGKRTGENFKDDEEKLLYSLALQTAVAIENSQLNEDMEKTYFETISALALAVDAKDRYSRGHLDRVANYVVRIAQKMNLGGESIKTLRDAAKLHDVGKIGVPDEVLMKSSPLTPDEMVIMKKHTEIGETIIKPIRQLRNLCDIVRHHHEKLDGTGYPDGLRSDQISLLVRITTVADIYDALTTDRPYRKRHSFEDACRILRDLKGQIDQSVVEAFLSTFNSKHA